MNSYKNKLSLNNKIYRFLWNLTWYLVFKNLKGKVLNRIRVNILRVFGAKIANGAGVYSSCRIWYPKNLTLGENSWLGPYTIIYNVGEIKLGKNVTVSQYSHLCAASHNYKSSDFELIWNKIEIEDNVWIATDAFISMGVKIGKNSIIGARSCVYKSIEENNIVVGNPAKTIKIRE